MGDFLMTGLNLDESESVVGSDVSVHWDSATCLITTEIEDDDDDVGGGVTAS